MRKIGHARIDEIFIIVDRPITTKPIIPTHSVFMYPECNRFSTTISSPLDITQFIVKENDES